MVGDEGSYGPNSQAGLDVTMCKSLPIFCIENRQQLTALVRYKPSFPKLKSSSFIGAFLAKFELGLEE